MLKLQASGADGQLGELVFSGDGRFLVALSPRGTGSASHHIHVWQLPDGASSSTIVTTNWHVIWGKFGPTGNRLIASGSQLGIIDLPSGKSAGPVPLPRPWTGVFCNLSRDGRYAVIAGAGGSPFGGTFRCGLALARADSLHSPEWVIDTDHPSGDSTWFLAAGDRVATVEYRVDSGGHTAKSFFVVRSTATGEVVRDTPFSFSVEPVQQPILSPDDRWLVNPVRNRIDLYAVAEATPTHSVLRNDNRKHFTGIAFHPSGKYLAATSNDATVKLYDTATWEVARTFTWDIGRMRSIAFSPDGTLAAAGSDKGKVVVWDVDL